VGTSVAALALDGEATIVDGSHVERAKPEPDLLLLAAKELGVAPQDSWYVGDSTWDMLAARRAGMTAVAVMAGAAVSREELRQAGAHIVVAGLGELLLGR
jgi:phosphoglycolate phosphatase-like HAD superfamily hydrolase